MIVLAFTRLCAIAMLTCAHNYLSGAISIRLDGCSGTQTAERECKETNQHEAVGLVPYDSLRSMRARDGVQTKRKDF